jgi:hypothetical protein
MSEYAIRKSDGKEIYIGSCEDMSCLRYEDRNKVSPGPCSLDTAVTQDLYWRLPVPDEDGILPGDYSGSACYRKDEKCGFSCIHHEALLDNDPETFGELTASPGSFQLSKDALGLVLSVTCYHGLKLNETDGETRFGWSGRKDALCLCGVKNAADEMKALYTCVACDKMWSCSFRDIQRLVRNQEVKKRLFVLCSEYWEERNSGKDYPDAMTRITEGKATVSLKRWTNPFGDRYAVSIDTADDGQTDYFKTLESAFDCYMGY